VRGFRALNSVCRLGASRYIRGKSPQLLQSLFVGKDLHPLQIYFMVNIGANEKIWKTEGVTCLLYWLLEILLGKLGKSPLVDRHLFLL
jgi:hypothetical protein